MKQSREIKTIGELYKVIAGAVQWLNEVLFFNQTLVLVNSFVSEIDNLIKPANR